MSGMSEDPKPDLLLTFGSCYSYLPAPEVVDYPILPAKNPSTRHTKPTRRPDKRVDSLHARAKHGRAPLAKPDMPPGIRALPRLGIGELWGVGQLPVEGH